MERHRERVRFTNFLDFLDWIIGWNVCFFGLLVFLLFNKNNIFNLGSSNLELKFMFSMEENSRMHDFKFMLVYCFVFCFFGQKNFFNAVMVRFSNLVEYGFWCVHKVQVNRRRSASTHKVRKRSSQPKRHVAIRKP